MNKIFGVQQQLDIVVCKDAAEAVAKGFNYGGSYTAVEIEKVVVVQQGTEEGNSTVDLILVDAQGFKHVVMLTGALIKLIPC